MKSRAISWVLGLGMGLVAVGCGSDDDGPEQTSNPLLGLEPEDKLFYALGGPQGFEALEGLRITSSGSRYVPHESARPDDAPTLANDFDRTVSLSLRGNLMRTDVQREVQFLFTGPEQYTEVIRDDNTGATTQPFFGNPLGNLTSDRVAAIQVQEMLVNPHLLVSRFGSNIQYDDEANVDDRAHHRLKIEAAQDIYLFVDAQTGYLTRLDTREHDFYMRDVVTQVFYADWQTTEDGLAYPGSVRLVRGGLELLNQTVSEFEVNPVFEDRTFLLPDTADNPMFDEDLFRRGARSNGWYFLLGSIGAPFQGVDTMVNAVAVVDPGVWQLQGGSHHSFLVEQSAGLVLVDAPLYDDRSDALLDFIEERFPNKSITHVVASHFHEDHVAGIREVLGATRAKLVVHESTAEFWQDILAANSTIVPDLLARNPREVEIETVPNDGSLELPDSARPVELYDMNAEHAEDLLLTRDVSSNTVFVVDIYSPDFGEPFEPQALDATILENDIPTDDTLKIVGGHGPGLHGYSDLEGFL